MVNGWAGWLWDEMDVEEEWCSPRNLVKYEARGTCICCSLIQ